MSVKKKRRSPIFDAKNMLIIGIAVTAVIFSAFALRLFMPTEKDDGSVGFETSALETAADEASSAEQNTGKYGNGLTSVYSEESVAAAAVPPPEPEKQPTAPESTSGESGGANANSFVKPVSGAVIFDYSGEELVYSNTTQDWRTHNGIDFAGAEGEDVLAAYDGSVEAVTESGLLGNTVIVLHSGGLRTIYANLADTGLPKIGDNVARGAIIGKVGSSAAIESADPPHVHFEVSLNEETVNPYDYLEEMPASGE